MSGASAVNAVLASAVTITAETSAKQRTLSLFLPASKPREARISADNAKQSADNLPQKQQKQREPLGRAPIWLSFRRPTNPASADAARTIARGGRGPIPRGWR